VEEEKIARLSKMLSLVAILLIYNILILAFFSSELAFISKEEGYKVILWRLLKIRMRKNCLSVLK